MNSVMLFSLQVIFLERRENSLSTATLITTGSDGSVRAWSVCGGGLLGYFSASQGDHDSVISMTTDYANTILVTGNTAGFVKVMTSASPLCEIKRNASFTYFLRLARRDIFFRLSGLGYRLLLYKHKRSEVSDGVAKEIIINEQEK